MRLEFVSGNSSKFWQIERDGNVTTVTFGKIGSAGQSKPKEHADDAAAEKFEAKQIAAKKKEGYVEAAGGSGDKRSANSSAAVATIDLEGAAYPHFDLKEFTYQVVDDGKLELRFDSIDPPQPSKSRRKKKGSDDEEEEDEEEEDDWKSKSAWDNYGPNCSAVEGSLTAESPLDFSTLSFPTEVRFKNTEDNNLSELDIHCCDHQSTRDHVIKFLKLDADGALHVEWRGKIVMDSDEENPHAFTVKGKATKLDD